MRLHMRVDYPRRGSCHVVVATSTASNHIRLGEDDDVILLSELHGHPNA